MSNNSRNDNNPDADTRQLRGQQELPIFAATYQGHAIAIPKNQDFVATIQLIREAFPSLATVATSHISLLSQFDQFGGLLVEIRQNVWGLVLPLLKIVEVSTIAHANGESVTRQVEIVEVDVTDSQPSGNILVHVLGGPTDLRISIPETSTVRQLKDMVYERDPSIPRGLCFSNQGVDLLDDDRQLQEYQIVDQSIVSLVTNIQVYVTTPERSKVPMRITLYANVSSLKLLVNTRLEIPVYKQILVCAGEELDDVAQLGSYHQIVHNCQIFVDRLQTTQVIQSQLSILYPITVKPDWAVEDDDEDGDTYAVFATSTILDLKTLISNHNMIVPSRQSLQFGEQPLEDRLTLDHYRVKPGDVIVMKVSGQST